MSEPKHTSLSLEQMTDEWEADLLRRYPEDSSDSKDDEFRDYDSEASESVRDFYRENHLKQTMASVNAARDRFLPLRHREMGIWEAIEFLNELVDESDPDTEEPQIMHAVQTAEAMRADGRPDWFVLTGFIHDLGKVLCLFDEPQWAVVGDTFPVGCAFSERIVLSEYFADNPDSQVPEYQTKCGIYEEQGGLDQVLMSWGHDEYLYHVTKDYLPQPAQYIIRYHSFYAQHRDNAYDHLMNDTDHKNFAAVRAFNPYDLYTKHEEKPDLDKLLPYYEDLVSQFFPDKLQW